MIDPTQQRSTFRQWVRKSDGSYWVCTNEDAYHKMLKEGVFVPVSGPSEVPPAAEAPAEKPAKNSGN